MKKRRTTVQNSKTKRATKKRSSARLSVLTIGGATQDIIVRYKDAATMNLHTSHQDDDYLLLKEGSKIEVSELLYFSGGGANNTAISFKRLGFDVTTMLKIAADEQGAFVIQNLEEEGVNTDHVLIADTGRTGISIVIPSPSGDRVVFAFRGVNEELTLEELSLDTIASYDQIYLTSLSGSSSSLLLPIASLAKKYGISVATNPGTSQLEAGAPTLRESLPYIDTLILNSSEAKRFMHSLVQTDTRLIKKTSSAKTKKQPHHQPHLLEGPLHIENIWFNLSHFFQTILSLGPKIVVVTNGAEGVYCATKQTMYFHESIPCKAVNALGAGDAFGSGFVASLASGVDLENAIRYGIINATSVISHIDTKQGLLSLKELEKKSRLLDKKLLKKFSY